jgi:CubicO group peptidase (beta-lactamase class C family)
MLTALSMTWASDQSTAALEARVDSISNEAIAAHRAPGISVAIARGQQIVFARGYGMANLEHSVAVTPETVFHIASISKNILAAVVMRLVDQHKLKLDDDVTKYVPEAPVQGRQITVGQLLNHTSGLYSFTDLPNAEANERLDLSHAGVLALFGDKPLNFEPGTRFRYNNSAFYLAGMVVERVTGQDYATYIRNEIFLPLGMTSARLCDSHMLVPKLASGYDRENGNFVPTALFTWKLPWAPGAVCATAGDLVRWQLALDAGRVVTAESLTMMRSPTVLADGTRIDYGLGTRLGALEGHRAFGHTGGGGGFSSILVEYPDDHLIMVVLANRAGGASLSTGRDLARAALELPEKKLLDLPVAPAEAAALSGTFDSDEGKFEQFVQNGKVHFRVLGQSGSDGVLYRQSDTVYALPDGQEEVHALIRNGQLVWGMVYSCGLMMDAVYRVR